MKKSFSICFVALACAAEAQHVTNVYNRDTHDQFKLKDVQCVSVVRGPIVKQEATYAFENPFTKLTEASVWFDLNQAAILSDFGYWYKDEYVPGVLMDKDKAWFIYTAITSRNEDPGIMVQTSPSSYHAQIFPLAAGHDFRVKLTSLGFLTPENGRLVVPQPTGMKPDEGQRLASGDGQEAPLTPTPFPTTVRSAQPETLRTNPSSKTFVDYPKDSGLDMLVYAQKHKDGYTYVAGMLRTDKPNAKVTVSGIHKVYWTRPDGDASDGSVKLFIGRRKGPGTLKVVSHDKDTQYERAHYIKSNEPGSDTVKLWAHQKLVQDPWRHNKDVLNFSLKYQIPSAQTALLAVPQEELKVFKKKAAEYRRMQAEEARKHRSWQSDRQQNWSTSSGGDPEVRVFLPGAKRVYAVLPDGRSFELVKANDGYWGGNYDIPADAPEGDYKVTVHAVDGSGHETEQAVSYQVDRTAPTGVLKVENGFLVLTPSKKLAKVIVVFGDGTEERMVEMTPGVYKLPLGAKRVVKVVMIDLAHNVSELPWSK